MEKLKDNDSADGLLIIDDEWLRGDSTVKTPTSNEDSEQTDHGKAT